jgi:hypothetical protein
MIRNLEIVNVGSSQSKFAFDYNNCGFVGMNWAFESQSFNYDFRILKQYHSYLQENAFVLLPVSPFSFFFSNTNDLKNYLKYYQFLNPGLIHNYSNKDVFVHIKYPIIGNRRSIFYLIKDVEPDVRIDSCINSLNAMELYINAAQLIDRLKKRYFLDDLCDIRLSDENKINIDRNILLLQEMIDFCLERTYRPIIIILPVTSHLKKHIPDSFIDAYVLDNIKKSNIKDIPVLNYFYEKQFSSEELFLDAFLFNLKGRKLFTKQVLYDLDKWNVLSRR